MSLPTLHALRTEKNPRVRATILYYDLRNRRAQHQKRQARAAEMRQAVVAQAPVAQAAEEPSEPVLTKEEVARENRRSAMARARAVFMANAAKRRAEKAAQKASAKQDG